MSMAVVDPAPPPPRSRTFRLRRAANISSPRKEDEELTLAPVYHDANRQQKTKDRTLRASIKRRFQQVRNLSSRSKSLERKAAGEKELPRHSRSQSEVLPSRPVVVPPLENGANHKSHDGSSLPTSSALDDTPDVIEEEPSSTSAAHGTPSAADITVPQLLQEGTPMTKVSSKKQKRIMLRMDADQGQILWDSKILPIECIKELRSGPDARYHREHFQLSQDYESRWLTIIYILDGKYKFLHLIAATVDVFQMWDTTIRKLHAIRQEIMAGMSNLEMRQAVWEKQYWKCADEEADQKLMFDEVEKLCRRLNVNSSSQDLYGLFKQADVNRRGYLDFQDFKGFVRLLKGRPELAQLYNKLRKSNNDNFDFSVFSKFMREVQKSRLSTSELQDLFDRFSMVPSSTPRSENEHHLSEGLSYSYVKTMSLDGFTSFLLSPDNAVFVDQNRGIWQDMTRPLSEYYISSSHNTYLVGHQLVGISTIEGYIRALLHGCRSVEVDIFDGDLEPMIFHGKTFTSKVSLREVCRAIHKYGFVATPYPIIISAEIHCGVTQQDMIVDIMTEVFGDSLIRAPIHGRPRIDELPSPEELKGCILLKAKNLYVVSDADGVEIESSSTDTSTSSASESERKRERENTSPEKAPVRPVRKHRHSASSPGPSASSPPLLSPKAVGLVRSLSRRKSRTAQDKPKVKMSFALVALLVYTIGVKYRGINKKEEYAPEHMFSLSENTCNKMMRQGMVDLIKHNKSHLVRIYPRGTRLKSSNFEPHRFWSTGAQLVAINWQTFDLGYMINHAMFQRNGRAGYVLKPQVLRTADKQSLSKRTESYLDITLISAQQLPRPKDALGREKIDKAIFDPFVEVSIHIPDWTQPMYPSPKPTPNNLSTATPLANTTTARTYSYRTNSVKNNGFNPVWMDKLRIPFDYVGDMKDLVFVRFMVKQEDKEDDEPLALYCAPLGCLQQGFRHLPLHDAQLSQYLFSTLFVHIDIQDIPS